MANLDDNSLPPCPVSECTYTYELGAQLVCLECANEWTPPAEGKELSNGADEIRDSLGNILKDGDSVTIARDLPVKGAPKLIKAGTKVNKIRLVHDIGDDNVDAKVDGVGPMILKSSAIKKA